MPPRPARSYRWPTIGELWTFLGFALPALGALLVPMPAVDLAYQLRAGAEILQSGAIPTTDTWTFTINGQPWVDQQWGAQVLLALVYQAAGWTGLAILRAVLVGSTFALVQATLRSMGCAQRPAALLALASFAVAAPALALRPQLFGVVLFAASMYVVADRRAHPRRLWLLPVFGALWANLHGTFPLIVIVVGLGWLDEFSRRVRARRARQAAPKGFQQPPDPGAASRLRGSTGIALLGAVTAIATLVTPFGIEAWWYVVRLASNPEVSAGISEWRPPSPFDGTGAVFYLSLLIAVAVLLLRVRRDGNRVGLPILAPVVTLLGFAVLGIFTGRGLAWWALVLPIAGAELAHDANLTRLLPRALAPIGALLAGPKPVRSDGSPVPPGSTAAAAAAARAQRGSPLNFAVGVVLALAAVALLPLWRPLGPAGVPVGVLSYAPQGITAGLETLLTRTYRGYARVWAPQVWTSWLEWMVPKPQYAVDSRVELYSSDLLGDAREIAAGAPVALDRVDAVDIVIATKDAGGIALEQLLRNSGLWVIAYKDAEGSIWIRTIRNA
ncbi:MAG TPA: hypothetical protein VJ850_09350 [Candidatus Limnocylindrales bacterium]|nr:hypothetical protein [Candidatus Limnocylindrales bacterium]